MKTLVLRVERHNKNAARVAHYLEGHPLIERVNYPGLESHPDHEIATGQMRGFGGMLAFELNDSRLIDEILSHLRLIMPALSLGGVESLICVPTRTTHRTLTPDERARTGIGEGLVRLSVGIEDAEDLIGDLDQAFAAAEISSRERN